MSWPSVGTLLGFKTFPSLCFTMMSYLYVRGCILTIVGLFNKAWTVYHDLYGKADRWIDPTL